MQALFEKEVTLDDILVAREKRALLQAELREAYGMPVVSISINMPGSIKYNDDIISLLYSALDKLRQNFRVEGFNILEERIYYASTGPGAMLAVKGDAVGLKQLTVKLEQAACYARLLDIDVFDGAGAQLSRSSLGLTMRQCLVCDNNAVICMRKQAHGRDEVIAAAHKLLALYKEQEFKDMLPKTVESIGIAALEAMLMEVACTPAPGLVDRANAGAHRDMDFFTFIKSISALSASMQRCALAGWSYKGQEQELLPLLRSIGREAEKEMFKATQGINTQKGILFLMGIMAAASAVAAQHNFKHITAQLITDKAAAICQGIVARELDVIAENLPRRKLTAGERFYIKHGITGVRGEIEAGLPSVHQMGLPCLRQGLEKGLTLNDALVHALLGLMSIVQDTTILNRHGLKVLRAVQEKAKNIMDEGGMFSDAGYKQVNALDQLFIRKNISPGGSADLLAVTYFLYLIEERKFLNIIASY